MLELPVNIFKYLKKNNEYTGHSIVSCPENLYDGAVVIPSLAEKDNLPPLLKSLEDNTSDIIEKVLIIFVVNNTPEANDAIKQNNLESIELLKDYNGKLNLCIVDASTKGNELNSKNGGVGLARKIGMDFALTKLNYNFINPFIACTDGDSTLSNDYLESIYNEFKEENIHAAYVDYNHTLTGDEEINRAIINYEIFLRYYVIGLKYAGSPYAFHTIGSTMVCSADAYVKIGGMNKRKAGEDFYFMEKLAKNYEVKFISKGKVFPSSRPSWRVPFGTGQRVQRHISNERDEYLVYHPECFDVLKKWNAIFLDNGLDISRLLDESKVISKKLHEFLLENKFEESMYKIKANCKTEIQLDKQKRFWFDGFRTLKLIHFLRDNEFGSIETFEGTRMLMENFSFNLPSETNKFSTVEIQYEFLLKLREFEKQIMN